MLNTNTAEQLGLFDLSDRSKNKELGQFFTNQKTADYMASMLHPMGNIRLVNILDAGAGKGILAISAAHRCLAMGYKRVHIALFELDTKVLPELEKNMEQMIDVFIQRGGEFSYKITDDDFILSRPDRDKHKFHISIINPPYFKYNSKDSIYSEATADLFKGNPNIYASFMAVASSCLVAGGQMVAIIPRSFTNGLYFKGFRNRLQAHTGLEKIHIFRSRNSLFKNTGVLQENIICKFINGKQQPTIDIYSSTCSEDLAEPEIHSYPQELILDNRNQHNIIRIPENLADARILKTVETWPSSFEENNYTISTGPIVEHRTKRFITTTSQTNSVPMLRMHNIKAFKIKWTGQHWKDAYFILRNGHEKHTSKNTVYVILKRFSSKDEKRRLIAGIHDPKKINSDLIGLENHLNYISIQDGDMKLVEAFGLAALFNSTFMDRYFRSISGNTQVNATEIRLIKMPIRDKIIEIGEQIQASENHEQSTIDEIILSTLKVQHIP